MDVTPQKVNEWRVIPRLLVLMYGMFCLYVGLWFMDLPAPSGAQSTFVSVIWGSAAVWFGFYVNSGNPPRE